MGFLFIYSFFLRYHLHIENGCNEFWQMHNSHLWRCRMFLSFQKVHSCPFPHIEHYSCFLLPHISFVCSEILRKWHYIIYLSLHPSFFSSSMFLHFVLFLLQKGSPLYEIMHFKNSFSYWWPPRLFLVLDYWWIKKLQTFVHKVWGEAYCKSFP